MNFLRFLLVIFLVCFSVQTIGDASEVKPVKDSSYKLSWEDFYSATGKCFVKFPGTPDYFKEKVFVEDANYDLKYDAYVTSVEKKNVFLLLVAEYPDFIDETYAQVSLEGFLNGILMDNPANQLLSASAFFFDDQHEALDFFIKTGNMYFKGRAIMVRNILYLLALECDSYNYNEKDYDYFIDSFKLSESKK